MFKKTRSTSKVALIIVCLLMIISLVIPSVVFAQAGTGTGSQSSSPGVPGQKPLGYLGTVLPDGTKVDNSANIPINPNFKVEFDKNVVNSLVWTNNSQCFSMKTGTTTVPIKVTKIDDTVDFSQRQNIFVQPASALIPGTSYQLIISPNLQAKNEYSTLGGTTNGQGVTVTFKTQGAAPATTPSTPVPAPQTTTKTTPSTTTPGTPTTPKTTTTTPPGTTAPANPSAPNDTSNQNTSTVTPDASTNLPTQATTPSPATQSATAAKKPSGISATTWLTILGAVLVAGWIAIEFFIRKKRKK